jgi:hypothetical protein
MESQARFGSIAGAGLKPEAISQQVSRINELRREQDREPSYTAQDLLRDKTATEMRYGREAQLTPLAPDMSGRTITPSMLDARGNIRAFTAAPPTFSQLGGDIMRGITGGTAFTRAAGLPNPEDAQGIMALASKASPLLNLLGVDFSPQTGPATRSMAQDYVGQTGMFTPVRRQGIESIPDATDSPAFSDMTPQDILETPLESIDDIVKTFKQSFLVEELLPTAETDEQLQMLINSPVLQRKMELYRKYPEIYNQVVNREI